ncbi:cardiolipin synthase [Tannockella kyphosi]|uniref:cardiolipin synthase n=1 Tax=Tannockella kyphosi TaxID=2899121 RepID=UPI00201313C6|nr:cardiolipin synthase [Tannockella kyphosi]
MMKLIGYLHNRIFLWSFAIIVQLFLFVMFWIGAADSFYLINLIAKILSVLAVLYIINKNVEAGYKMIWILLILLMPVLGGMMYLVFGNKKPSKKLRECYDQQPVVEYLQEQQEEVFHLVEYRSIKTQLQYLLNEQFPSYSNTKTTYYSLGEDNYDALLEDLKKAKHFIFMEYFIVKEGEMLESILAVLRQKVQEGVEVRFLYDDMGCLMTLDHKYYEVLESYGIQCIAFNRFVPLVSFVMNNRDHRKITVIDGTIAYTGGINIADEYINKEERFGHWKDTGLRLEGQATWNLTVMFLQTWNASKNTKEDFQKYHPKNYDNNKELQPGVVVPYGDSPLDENPVGQDVYLNMINHACSYLYICTPYLIINEQIHTALVLASKRGVDVRICTPGIPDKKTVFRVTRSYYGRLIDNGVRIYEYTPGFLHSKTYVCDDNVATVGTVNMDYRSLFLHFECGVYMYRTPSVIDVRNDFFETISKGKEIKKEDVVKGRFYGLFEAVLRVLAPLM